MKRPITVRTFRINSNAVKNSRAKNKNHKADIEEEMKRVYHK